MLERLLTPGWESGDIAMRDKGTFRDVCGLHGLSLWPEAIWSITEPANRWLNPIIVILVPIYAW